MARESISESERVASIIGIYPGIDWANTLIPDIAFTSDRLERLKELLLSETSPCCAKEQYLYVIVKCDRGEFILRCTTARVSINPKRLGEALLSARAAERMGIKDLPAILWLKKMERHCEEGAGTAQLILSTHNRREVYKNTSGPATLSSDNLARKEVEALVPEDF